MNEITFVADSVRINGPKLSGGTSVTFEVGEYMYDRVKDLPSLSANNNMITVVVIRGNPDKIDEFDIINNEITTK